MNLQYDGCREGKKKTLHPRLRLQILHIVYDPNWGI